MYKYVFDLHIGDVLKLDTGERVVIDSFVELSEDSVFVNGYYEESGDDFCAPMDLNDEIRVDIAAGGRYR